MSSLFAVEVLMCFFLSLCRTTWIKRTKESGRAMQQDHKQFERSLNFQLPKQRTTARVCRAEGTGCSGWLAFSLHTGTAAHLLPETGRFGASPFHYRQAVSGHLTLLSQTTLPKGKCPPEQANGSWLTANIFLPSLNRKAAPGLKWGLFWRFVLTTEAWTLLAYWFGVVFFVFFCVIWVF